jgi:hypothetical protein
MSQNVRRVRVREHHSTITVAPSCNASASNFDLKKCGERGRVSGIDGGDQRWLSVVPAADSGLDLVGLDQLISPLILTRLWAKMPWPHHVRAPVSPSIRVLESPKSRLAQLILPSQPVRHRTILRKARRFSIWRRVAFGRPLVGSTT